MTAFPHFRARRERIAAFHRECNVQVARLPVTVTQKAINATETIDELQALLDAEKATIEAMVAGIAANVGPIPWHRRMIARHELVELRLSGLDLRGFVWAGQKFSYSPPPAASEHKKTGHEDEEPPTYRHHPTGRLMSEAEYQSMSGSGRSGDFMRIK